MIRQIEYRSGPIAIAVLAVLILGAALSPNRATAATIVEATSGKHAGEMTVPLNKSQILRVDQPFTDLLVGNSAIADVLPLTDRTIYVLGKALGRTNLSVYGKGKRLLAVLDLSVIHDSEGLKAKLFELLPNEKIDVRTVNSSVILSGSISSANRAARAMSIAQSFAPKMVTNLLQVQGSHQVMLEVRFAEMARSTGKELGINWDALFNSGSFIFGLATGLPTTISGNFPDGTIAVRNNAALSGAAATNTLFGNFSDSKRNVSSVIDALETRGLIKTLAEPTLIALSGETAKFLAGGEFPIPVAQDEDSITIVFKEFGVSLAFTPTVLDNGLINLVVNPEVSQLDLSTTATTLAGSTIPGLTTRRASTTVELRDGQSFAIAGLLQNDFSDSINQLPGLGDIPILGALFRSTQYQRNETELVIIVTPRLVQPVKAGTLATPTDNFVPPSEGDLFFMGKIEAKQSGSASPRERAGYKLGAQSAGGVDGPYGHIIK
jgi:pilus assembly protein CpaC